jgi:hypothetical protein
VSARVCKCLVAISLRAWTYANDRTSHRAAFSAARAGRVREFIDRKQGVNDPGRVPASPATPFRGSFTPCFLLLLRRRPKGRGIVRTNVAVYIGEDVRATGRRS